MFYLLVVIQVSTGDPLTQTIALNNAVNLQKALGPGNAQIEIVAYGPGLSLLTKNSKQAKRVAGLAMYDDITLSACGNTMKKIEKKIWPEYFQLIFDGKKKYEFRLAGWDCEKGDILSHT